MTKETKTTKEFKPKFDTEDFVFKTDITKIEAWLQKMLDDLDDVDLEWPSYDEQCLLAVWLRDIDFYRANNIPYTLTSAKENAIMGLFEKPKKTARNSKKK